MRRAGPVLILAAAAIGAGCVDFGYQADPPVGFDAGPPMVPDGCVEGEADPATATLSIVFFTLDVDQRAVVVEPGGVIAWINSSSQMHTATAGAPGADLPPERGGFDSGNMAPGGSTWAYRFCDPRTITWYCRTHPAQMFGYTIVVGSGGGGP